MSTDADRALKRAVKEMERIPLGTIPDYEQLVRAHPG